VHVLAELRAAAARVVLLAAVSQAGKRKAAMKRVEPSPRASAIAGSSSREPLVPAMIVASSTMTVARTDAFSVLRERGAEEPVKTSPAIMERSLTVLGFVTVMKTVIAVKMRRTVTTSLLSGRGHLPSNL